MTVDADLPVLYHYYRSSSSWRVRWALAHKGLSYRGEAVDLLKGEQRAAAHKEKNPLGTVPVLYIDGVYIAESVAILEYLEEARQAAPLLPKSPKDRARVRQLVQIIVADTQPLQNLGVLQHVEKLTGVPESRKKWAEHYIAKGLDAVETLLTRPDWPQGPYCYGDAVTMADLCLIPQCYNARRQELDIGRWPRIAAIEAAALATEAAKSSHPDVWQPKA
jgi:maleylacetoacetate isomerase